MRRDLLVEARGESLILKERFPQVATIDSIINQLDYLIALSDGETVDRSRLAEIILGVQAAREIEALDMDLAEKLHEINAEVGRM